VGILVACDRPPSDGVSGAQAPAPVASIAPRRATAVLVNRYLYSADVAERRRLLQELRSAPADEGLPAVERLLASEREATLRSELYRTLEHWEGNVALKVRVLEQELIDDPRAGAVDDAALEALLGVHDRAALPLWWQLLDDPRDQVRAIAQAAVAQLEDGRPDTPE